MSNPVPSSPVWPAYPDIPIHLDVNELHFSRPRSYRRQPTRPSISSSASTSGPNHFLPRQPPPPPPPPPPPSSKGRTQHRKLAETNTKPIRIYTTSTVPAIVVPDNELPRRKPPPDRQLPPLPQKFGPYGLPSRPDVARLKQPSSNQSSIAQRLQVDTDILGIRGGPKQTRTTTPVDSGSGAQEEKEKSPNLAQRIETKLWKINHSENVVLRWGLEIASWAISCMCMSSIVILLILLEDKPLQPLPLNITLNALISVLSRISAAALMVPTAEALGQLKWNWFRSNQSKKLWDFEIFDEASRGPWGSFLLLMRTKGKSLAAMGATITILALALDPFFQQVIDFPQRWILNTQVNSSIARTVYYDPGTTDITQGGKILLQPDDDIVGVVRPFFYDNGTQPIPSGNGTRLSIPLACPTGNCNWEPYQTLGVCSACNDITEYLQYACITAPNDWRSDALGFKTRYDNVTTCGYFLNATGTSPVLMSGYSTGPNLTELGETLTLRLFPLVSNPLRQSFYGGSLTFKNISDPLADFFVVGSPGGADAVHRNETPIAKECILSWCTKTVESSYSAAGYLETVRDDFINRTIKPSPWATETTNGTVKVSYLNNVTIERHDPLTNTTRNFGMTNYTALGIILALDEIFPAYVTANISEEAIIRSYNSKSLAYTRPYPVNFWTQTDPHTDVSNFVERLATEITNTIRSSHSNEMVHGIAYDLKVFVDVRWWWLALPLTLLFASLVFLIATIIRSTNEKPEVGILKNSAIAALLYGLPGSMREKIATSTKIGTPRTKAKEIKVKLLSNKHGWRVSGQPFSPSPPKPQTQHNWAN